METYRLSVESQEAVFALANGDNYPYTILRGKVFVAHSDMPGAFHCLLDAMADNIDGYPLKCLSTMQEIEKLSADYKGCAISFVTTMSIDGIEKALKTFFDSRKPAPAPEIQYRGGGLAKTTFC